MSQKLPVDGFKWVKEDDLSNFNQSFIKHYDENSDKGYILKVDIKYSINLHMPDRDLSFLSERMKINKSNKFVCNAHTKKLYS